MQGLPNYRKSGKLYRGLRNKSKPHVACVIVCKYNNSYFLTIELPSVTCTNMCQVLHFYLDFGVELVVIDHECENKSKLYRSLRNKSKPHVACVIVCKYNDPYFLTKLPSVTFLPGFLG